MDASHPHHSSLPSHDLDTRHYLQHQPHSSSEKQTYTQPQFEPPPPSKRRRANSTKPVTVASTVEPTTFPPSAHWHSPYLHPLQNDPVPRPNSPDRNSYISTNSAVSLTGPQLRKKPKSGSIKNTNLLRVASITIGKSPSIPDYHSPTQPDPVATQTPVDQSGKSSVSINRTNSGSSQIQSPNQKRPPASHSSYGIETICGPPPSYSTQRTLSQERIRKLDRNTKTRMQASSSDPAHSIALDDTLDISSNKKEITILSVQSSPDTADTQSIPTPTEVENMTGARIRGEPRSSIDGESKVSSSDERRSEDLFLNIARVDAARPLETKPDKRRSRLSIPFLSTNRSVQPARSSPEPTFEPTQIRSPQSEAPNFHNKRTSIGNLMQGTNSSRNNLIDRNRYREQSAELISENDYNSGAGYIAGVRRASTIHTDSARLAQRSSAGLRGSRLVSETTYNERPKTAENIATESTVSTGAPSTVWDELDDLKSRIRKLEITGKWPSTSAAAMSSTERPRTATTAATTISTSPRNKPSEPNLQSTIEDTPSNFHPLLHEALDNARVVVSQDIFQKLQATAQDALELAAMVSSGGSGVKSYQSSQNNERQMKRRTEGMCRSLTELAIALAAETSQAQSNIRPASRDYNLPPNSMLRGRRYSNDAAERSHVPSRVQSRLESRRTSMHLNRAATGFSSPERGPYQSSGPAARMTDARANGSSALLRRRGQGSFDGIDDRYDTNTTVRPGSRAITELGSYRRASRDHMLSPKEYTSQNPLPTPREQTIVVDSIDTPISGGFGANFASRRKYTSPIVLTGSQADGPMTPRDPWSRISTFSIDTPSPDVVSEAGLSGRQVSSRRSVGLAGRIGTSVGSRLRAVRAERNSQEVIDMSPSIHTDHITPGVDVVRRRADNM